MIMKKKTVTIGIIGVIAVIGLGAWGLTRSSSPQAPVSAQNTGSAEVYYTCPMHPSVHSDHPGACPVCNMTLVKKSQEETKEYYICPMDEGVRSDHPGACPICGMTLVKKSVQADMEDDDLSNAKTVSLSPTQQVMANITTARVQRQTINNDIRSVGVVSYAEPNYRIISMRFAGRVEKLYLTFTGQAVHKGDPVAEVYSPDATIEEQAYLRALDMYNQTTRSGEEVSGPVSVALQRQKQRLLQLGFTEKQIDDLSESDTLSTLVTILSPVSGTVVKKSVDPGRFAETGTPLFDVADLSTVWILLDVYEKDIPLIRPGYSVKITTEAYPLEKFRGRVVFMDPVVTPETRTIRVRTEFPNPQGKLMPNMYVNATISAPQSNVLVVPSTAILPMGKRSVIWIEVKENTFSPRDVVVGPTSNGVTAVLEGLDDGDVVAATGGFLIDSESAFVTRAFNRVLP